MKSKKLSELNYLESYRLVFANYNKIEELKNELASYGYDEQLMNEGHQLYLKAKELYDVKRMAVAEEKEAYSIFKNMYDKLSKEYDNHRKVAKVALMNHKHLWKVLSIDGEAPKSYLKKIEYAEMFYKQSFTHQEAKQLLEKFKITQEISENQLESIKNIIEYRTKYEYLSSKNQQATKDKNIAFTMIDKWIRNFYAVAKIALNDKQQLLEAIGKITRI